VATSIHMTNPMPGFRSKVSAPAWQPVEICVRRHSGGDRL